VDVNVILWLFGGCATAIVASFGFCWTAHGRISNYREELYAYKLHAAEYFASFSHTSALERRTAEALDEIKRGLKDQGLKLDRLVERK
jgi:hypothetical protein